MNMHECYLLACRTNTEYTNQNKNKLPKKGGQPQTQNSTTNGKQNIGQYNPSL